MSMIKWLKCMSPWNHITWSFPTSLIAMNKSKFLEQWWIFAHFWMLKTATVLLIVKRVKLIMLELYGIIFITSSRRIIKDFLLLLGGGFIILTNFFMFMFVKVYFPISESWRLNVTVYKFRWFLNFILKFIIL